jgi:hypothetical protein
MEALDRPAWNPARQCTGTNRAGERCQRQPIAGGTVCIMHGAAAPQVQQAAKTRLLAMVEPVLATFEDILALWHSTVCTGCGHVDENGVKCVGCGKPTGDPMPVIRVGQLVLDRSGFHPTLQLLAPAASDNPYAHLTEDELIERLEESLAKTQQSLDLLREQRLLNAGTVDGVVDDGFVPEDDEPAIQIPDVQIPVGNVTPDEGKDDK